MDEVVGFREGVVASLPECGPKRTHLRLGERIRLLARWFSVLADQLFGDDLPVLDRRLGSTLLQLGSGG